MKDDWQKPRGHNQHFTSDELAKIRAAFDDKRKAADVARDLKCSTRVINGYFARFRNPVKVVVQRFRPQIPCRHYKSNFEV